MITPSPHQMTIDELIAKVCVCLDGIDRTHDGWPDDTTDGQLCQLCWEAQCSREWWDMLHQLDRAGIKGVLA